MCDPGARAQKLGDVSRRRVDRGVEVLDAEEEPDRAGCRVTDGGTLVFPVGSGERGCARVGAVPGRDSASLSIQRRVVRVAGERPAKVRMLSEETIMGKVIVVEHVTLDGVMQAPGGADEDRRGGFPYGGWARPYADQVVAAKMGMGKGKGKGKGKGVDGGMLFGRRTYEQFYGFWSKQTDGNPYTEVLNRRHKYVASRTLAEPLPWENSSLLEGDAADAVAALKRDVGGDLVVLGSGELVRSLARSGLVDVYTLAIHPLTLGTGMRLFAEGEDAYRVLELVETVTTRTGVIIATYRPTARESHPA